MVYHILGRKYTSKILDKVFGKGHLSWPGGSIFYWLKKLGLASEGSNYIIELRHDNGLLCLYLKDLYGNMLRTLKMRWDKELPASLTQNNAYVKAYNWKINNM